MMITRKKAVKWGVLTTIAPQVLCMLAANLYVAGWFMTKQTGYYGPIPPNVIQRSVMVTAAPCLWLVVLLWWLIFKKAGSFGELFGTRVEHVGRAVVTGTVIGAVWVIVYGLLNSPPFGQMFILDTEKLVSLPTSISAGFCEEFLFRGFLLRVIAATGASKMSQLLWTSLAFGFAHLAWGPVGMLATFILGLSFASIALRQGNVWASVVAHTILNICIEPALMEQALSSIYS
jgi:membrane protease YdiL (CAAX protease family)